MNFTFGTELNFEGTSGKRILDGEQDLNTYAVFASTDFSVLEKLNLQPGLRYTYNDTYGDLLTPAFNLKMGHGQKRPVVGFLCPWFSGAFPERTVLGFQLSG